MDAEPGRAGFEVYAFTQRLGQNVVVLHPYPETALDLVRRTVIDGGVGASLLAADLPGQGTAMIVAEDFITEEQVGHVTDDLTLRGVGAYGYAFVGGAFRRVGQAWPREGRRVVLAHTFVHQSGPDLAATSWVMGAPGDLEDLGRVLDPVVGVELFGDDAGVAQEVDLGGQCHGGNGVGIQRVGLADPVAHGRRHTRGFHHLIEGVRLSV